MKIYQAVQNISIDPKANAFRLFLPYSKQLGLVSMATCRFCPTVNDMPWLSWLHQVKIVCDVTSATI
jgi:hypothetical protein